MNASSRVGIVVVDFGSANLISANFGTIDTVALDACVVVVDNFRSTAGSDHIADVCRANGWTLVSSGRNLGFGVGMNRGVEVALGYGCQAVILVNPDVTVSTNTCLELARQVLADPDVLVSPTIVRPDGSSWFSGSSLDPRTGTLSATRGGVEAVGQPWLTGACLALHRSLWSRLGGFDASYFLYWEDIDLSRRVVESGGRLVVRDDLFAVHDVGGTQRTAGTRRKSSRYYFYNCRNRLLFAARHLDRRGILRWLAATPQQSWLILMRGGRRQLLAAPVGALAAVGGSLAGVGIALLALIRGHPGPVSARRPIVMVSYTAANRDPLTSQLFAALAEHADMRHFSWTRALLARYDVLNVHWPDHLTKRHGWASTAFRRSLYLGMLVRLRWGRPVLVRTVHNLAPHEGRRGLEAALLRLTDRWTTAYITMQPGSPLPSAAPGTWIPQGHYRDLYADLPHPDPIPGRLLFFGIVRQYKGVPALIDAFRATEDPDLTLRIVGRVFDVELGRVVRQLSEPDRRVELAMDWVSHEALAEEIGHSELVVLPYLEMHNSGTVVVALSLDRPVLVPRDPATLALSDEVGPGWVFTYDAPLTALILTDTLRRLRELHRDADAPVESRPDLSARDWTSVADRYATTYQKAIDGRLALRHS